MTSVFNKQTKTKQKQEPLSLVLSLVKDLRSLQTSWFGCGHDALVCSVPAVMVRHTEERTDALGWRVHTSNICWHPVMRRWKIKSMLLLYTVHYMRQPDTQNTLTILAGECRIIINPPLSSNFNIHENKNKRFNKRSALLNEPHLELHYDLVNEVISGSYHLLAGYAWGEAPLWLNAYKYLKRACSPSFDWEIAWSFINHAGTMEHCVSRFNQICLKWKLQGHRYSGSVIVQCHLLVSRFSRNIR